MLDDVGSDDAQRNEDPQAIVERAAEGEQRQDCEEADLVYPERLRAADRAGLVSREP